MFKKSLLTVLLCCCVIGLSACSSQKIVKIKDAKIEEIEKQINEFAITQGFSLTYADPVNHIYKITTDIMNYSSPYTLTTTPMVTYESGFGIKLKQQNNDVLINATSFGYGLRGYWYNKTGKFLKKLKQEGYTVMFMDNL